METTHNTCSGDQSKQQFNIQNYLSEPQNYLLKLKEVELNAVKQCSPKNNRIIDQTERINTLPEKQPSRLKQQIDYYIKKDRSIIIKSTNRNYK